MFKLIFHDNEGIRLGKGWCAMRTDSPKTEPMLREGLEFDSTDLTYNLGAVMTDNQREKLVARQQRLKRRAFAAWLLCIVVPVVLVLQFGAPFGWLAGGVLALFFGSIGFSLREPIQAVQADLRDGMVMRAAGPVRLEIKRDGPFARNYLYIEGLAFRVNDRVFLAFKNHERYYVHYAPRSKYLLSGEPVAKAFTGTR